MYPVDNSLTVPQICAHWQFVIFVKRPHTTAQDIINFLDSIRNRNLLIENLRFLGDRIDDERIHGQEFEPYWKILLGHIEILPQPNFTNFELLYSRA
jgi:hypothetical protein